MKNFLLFTFILFTLTVNAQLITTVAGNSISGYTGDNGLATDATINNARDIAVDSMGNLYIADYNNNVIRKVNQSTQIITTIAGNGNTGHSGDGGLATDASLGEPQGICLDRSGNLYIAQTTENVVRKINLSSGMISTIAGNGTGGYTGDNGLAVNATVNLPYNVCADTFGNLFICEFGNHTIRKINSATSIITTVAGTGSFGYSGDGGNATTAKLNFPNYVTVDYAGNVYISDNFNHVIRKVNTSGIISTIIGNGTGGYTGDGGMAINAQLDFPTGCFVDKKGNIYISDGTNHVIRKVTATTGIISTIAGDGTDGNIGDNTPATDAELSIPDGIKGVINNGNTDLYFADQNNNIIRKISSLDEQVKVVSSEDLKLYPNPTQGSFTIISAKAGTFYITDMLGSQQQITKVANGTNNAVLPTNISSGIYIGTFKPTDGSHPTTVKITYTQ